jgi:methionyl-tRNA formyltransferase
MRTVLVGVVKTAEAALRGLIDAHAKIVGIFTQEMDKVLETSGMERVYYINLKHYADKLGCPLKIVDNINDDFNELERLSPDVIYIVGWPQIIRGKVLNLATCIGMHPSRLPERRGGAPLNWQILDGEKQGAVTLFRLEEGLDSGDILIQREYEIGPHEYIDAIMQRVNKLTYELVKETYPLLPQGRVKWLPQDHTSATYARRRKPSDGKINWADSSRRTYNLIRAVSHPFPGAFAYLDGQEIRIWRAELVQGYRAPIQAVPGQVVDLNNKGILVSTLDNAILLTEIELEGYSFEEFSELYKFLIGKVLK